MNLFFFCLDFNEFLLSVTITAKGNLNDRLNWAFNYYDQNNNNYIEAREMTTVIKAIYRMMGVSNHTGDNSPENKAKSIFKDLDLNEDQKVSGHFVKSFEFLKQN
jgi:neuronal calcium sensor 1